MTAETHPDADALTAFAEQSLLESERKAVLEHLAQCAECRDVVSWALPALEDISQVPQRGAKTSWLTLPVLRWGIAVAGVLVIFSAGIFEYQWHREQIVLMARNTPRAVASQPYALPRSTEARTAPAQAPPSQARKDKQSAQQMQPESARRLAAKPAPVASPALAMALPKHSVAPATGSSRLSSSGAYESRNAASPQQPGPSKTFQAPANLVASGNDAEAGVMQTEVVGKAKAAPQAAPALGLARPPDLRADPGLMKGHSLVRWTISDKGTLQRSIDGGGSWQDVNVAVASDIQLHPAKDTMTVEASSAAPELKSQVVVSSEPRLGPKADSKAAAAPPPQAVIFRAVSVSFDANEVWAGGSGAALYHTVDAGNSWLRVLPSDSGAVLTGDVISIQFPDTRSGTISTSNAEIWITFDDGKTWHKQP